MVSFIELIIVTLYVFLAHHILVYILILYIFILIRYTTYPSSIIHHPSTIKYGNNSHDWLHNDIAHRIMFVVPCCEGRRQRWRCQFDGQKDDDNVGSPPSSPLPPSLAGLRLASMKDSFKYICSFSRLPRINTKQFYCCYCHHQKRHDY